MKIFTTKNMGAVIFFGYMVRFSLIFFSCCLVGILIFTHIDLVSIIYDVLSAYALNASLQVWLFLFLCYLKSLGDLYCMVLGFKLMISEP